MSDTATRYLDSSADLPARLIERQARVDQAIGMTGVTVLPLLREMDGALLLAVAALPAASVLILLTLSFVASVAVGLAAALVSVKEGRSNLESLRSGSSAFGVAMTLCVAVLAVARMG